NVLAIERRNEAAVERLDDPANDLVTGMLLMPDLIAPGDHAVEGGDHVEKFASGAADDRRCFIEHVEESLLARDQTEAHKRPLQGERCLVRFRLHHTFAFLSLLFHMESPAAASEPLTEAQGRHQNPESG